MAKAEFGGHVVYSTIEEKFEAQGVAVTPLTDNENERIITHISEVAIACRYEVGHKAGQSVIDTENLPVITKS